MRYPVALCAILALATVSVAQTPAPGQDEAARRFIDDLRVNVDGAFLYGPIRGFLQTPAGGRPGSSSADRPSFDELGFSNVSVYDTSIRAGWRARTVYAGARIVRLSGKSTLSSALITQNVAFPAGSRVDADAKLDWYRFGYMYRFDISPGKGRNILTLSPGADVAVLAFHYKLDGAAGSVDRAYTKAGLRLGAELDWAVTDRLTLRGRAFDSLPLANMARILTLELLARYHLWTWRRASLSACLGVTYDRIDHKDGQTFPNHIRAEMGPMLKLGLEMEF